MTSHIYDFNSFAVDLPLFVPADTYTYNAAAACGSSAGQTTAFSAKFAAPNTAAATETWTFTHAAGCTSSAVKALTATMMEHRISEFGAIAIIFAVLLKRDSIRVREVIKVGGSSDYVLEDLSGADAGTLEVSGTKSQYTSDVSNRKRKQAKKTAASIRRIGIVAFGGPQLLIERL